MRLWHKDLISVLPRQQLLSQWRECCCIIRNIAVNGTPNHLLVNKIMNYPLSHFYKYTILVIVEMLSRGYKIHQNSINSYDHNVEIVISKYNFIFKYKNLEEVQKEADKLSELNLFDSWHNKRYLTQCFYNLQEKADCGGISDVEYSKLYQYYRYILQSTLRVI